MVPVFNQFQIVYFPSSKKKKKLCILLFIYNMHCTLRIFVDGSLENTLILSSVQATDVVFHLLDEFVVILILFALVLVGKSLCAEDTCRTPLMLVTAASQGQVDASAKDMV